MNSSDAIRSSCVVDFSRCFGLTENTDGPVMTIGLCWMDRDRIRSVVALPFNGPADEFRIESLLSFNSLISGNEFVDS
jgi:hypothetical protein